MSLFSPVPSAQGLNPHQERERKKKKANKKERKKKNATATQPWPRVPRPNVRLLCLCPSKGVSHVEATSLEVIPGILVHEEGDASGR